MRWWYIKATRGTNTLALKSPLNSLDAYHRAVELQNDGFDNIVFTDTENGGQVTDVEELLRGDDSG